MVKSYAACPMCRKEWFSREEFLSDPEITLEGYKVNFVELKAGFFMFRHQGIHPITLVVEKFADLYEGEIFEERATGTDECPAYCLYEKELGRCFARCECAFVRDIIQIIKHWEKQNPKRNINHSSA